jgi:hypothetical protein
MNVGDLVKRKKSQWDELTLDELNELGMIIGFEEYSTKREIEKFIVVLWSTLGTSWEDFDALEVVNESR